ncbi:MAG: hypothetical protein H0V63_13335 [Burkholderiaceae bacterium]|nr:hypothetical protein [Burkholderiaceae bacterium]
MIFLNTEDAQEILAALEEAVELKAEVEFQNDWIETQDVEFDELYAQLMASEARNQVLEDALEDIDNDVAVLIDTIEVLNRARLRTLP